ncbi:MAG: hypothetical protein MI864_11145 [Pseudomonadales bacterium]|nr:hypothetical protein [Pseudomonadales bacterium]
MLACEITFYGKPKCVTNRKQVSMLRKAGIRVNEVNVLEHPWSPGELKLFLQGRPVENWLNPSAPAVKDGRFSLQQPEDVILQALCDEPVLIRRPLIEFETPNEPVRLSEFDPQRLTDLLGVTIETGLPDMEACSLTTSAQSVEQRNLDSLQLILTSQKQGKTSLPRLLGLSEMDFIKTQTQLSGVFGDGQSPVVNTHETDLRQELLNCRQDEFMELQALLLKFRANRIPALRIHGLLCRR